MGARARILGGRDALPLGVEAFDRAFGGGLPRGSVIELASPAGLGRATQLALRACLSAQAAGRSRTGESGWCAWIDTSATLYAPGVARVGIDLERLLVVRPQPSELGRIAVRVTASGVFSLVVIDRGGLPGSPAAGSVILRAARGSHAVICRAARGSHAVGTPGPLLVRRLALAAEATETTVVLMSPLSLARAEALPVAMRLELTRPALDRLSAKLTKDRRGGSSNAVSIPLVDLASELSARSADDRSNLG
jgi:recombination protein RecA